MMLREKILNVKGLAANNYMSLRDFPVKNILTLQVY